MNKIKLSEKIKKGMANCGKNIGRPRGKWKNCYKAPYGMKITRHCPSCGTIMHPYVSTLLYRTVTNKKFTEHSDIKIEAAKKKFFCGNKCKSKWIGKTFGFGNLNHTHWKPKWLRNQRDPGKDFSRLSEQRLQNLWDFHLEGLNDAEKDEWLVSNGYYNLPPPLIKH